MKEDIKNLEDVKVLVNTFYNNIRENELLGPIFNELITDWQPHLEKMYTFWDSILFGSATYSGKPFLPHANLPIKAEHFAQWVGLFKNTVDSLFEGDNANEAKNRAEKIAEIFAYKKDYLDNGKRSDSLL